MERFNRTLEAMLSKYISADLKDWDITLPLLMLAYRSSINDSTGVSPCRMMLGRDLYLPADLLVGSSPDSLEHGDPVLYISDHREKLHTIRNFSRARF